MIPTTSGTGSEVTWAAVFHDEKDGIKKAVWSPFFLETNGPVRLGKLRNAAKVHYNILALEGPAVRVCGRFGGAYSEEALDDIPSKDLGFHETNLQNRVSGRAVRGVSSQF